jgi:hypothetical protein
MHIKFRFALSKRNVRVLRRFGRKEANGGLGCKKERENGNKRRIPEHTYC